MSAKARFLKKLKAQPSRSGAFENKSQADIAEFRRRMGLLHEEMESWLTDSGIGIDTISVSLTKLLVGGEAFSVPGISLRFDRRMIKFTPLFLYGQGVTGCVEVAVCEDEHSTAICRLFMRSSEDVNWTWKPAGVGVGSRHAFGEDEFFTLLEHLLPATSS